MKSINGTKLSFLKSMRGKLVLLFLGLSLIPLIIVSVFAFIQSQNALRERTTTELQRLATNNASTIEDWLASRKNDLLVMASNAQIQSMDATGAKNAIDGFFKGWGRYETMFVVGLDGKSIATSDGKPLDLSERAYIKDALTGLTVISQPVFSKATGNLVMAIATPVKNGDEIVGAVGASVSMTYISSLMSASALGETGEAYMINSEGMFITPSRYVEKLKCDKKNRNHGRIGTEDRYFRFQ